MSSVFPWRALALALTTAALAGCASMLGMESNPFVTYAPKIAAPPAPAAGAPVAWQLVVLPVQANSTLDTARILVMPKPGVLEVFPGARWPDPAPAMLRSLVIQTLADSGRIIGVGSGASAMNADYSLALDLRDFQVDLSHGSARAVLSVHARLIDYARNRVVAARTFTAEAPAAAVDAAAALPAFEAALGEAIPALAEWCLGEGQRANAASASKTIPSPASAERQ